MSDQEKAQDVTPSGPQRFRKKPVVIEAWQLTTENVLAVALWCKGQQHAGPSADEAYVTIRTLEGEMHANVDDWIIRGIKGEFYPCKPDIFEATYEPAPSGSERE